MSELSVDDKPKLQEQTIASIKLETLGKGIANINSEYPLGEVLSFIKGLNVDTDVWTSQSDGALEIAFPTPTLFRINRLKEFDSNIYITGPLKKQEPEFKARGERQIWRPTDFVAAIELRDDYKKEDGPKVKGIILCAALSKETLGSMIKKVIGKIPNNWHINPHTTKPTKSIS
ncbi:MAG: hypothetical protein Q8P29_02480 [Candidatus Levybacteria bacterium]|nr:hypothetical protein [Candidatus Levybacteria bacterium]MDZ4227851.1 hypothetical protein [Candidatus Levybacteria bacterium]